MSLESNRAYQTDYEAHVGLMRKLVFAITKRAMSCGVNYEMDDAMQDAAVVFVKAAKGFDPSRGITFTAYLGRAIYNELNPIVDKMIAMRTECVAVNIEDLGEPDMDVFEVLEADDYESTEERLTRFEDMREKVSTLSPLARLFVRELNRPSEDLRKKLDDIIQSAKARRAAGERHVRVPEAATFSIVAQHHNVTKDKLYSVKREFKNKLGVDC